MLDLNSTALNLRVAVALATKNKVMELIKPTPGEEVDIFTLRDIFKQEESANKAINRLILLVDKHTR